MCWKAGVCRVYLGFVVMFIFPPFLKVKEHWECQGSRDQWFTLTGLEYSRDQNFVVWIWWTFSWSFFAATLHLCLGISYNFNYLFINDNVQQRFATHCKIFWEWCAVNPSAQTQKEKKKVNYMSSCLYKCKHGSCFCPLNGFLWTRFKKPHTFYCRNSCPASPL